MPGLFLDLLGKWNIHTRLFTRCGRINHLFPLGAVLGTKMLIHTTRSTSINLHIHYTENAVNSAFLV
jgi:hypothetical protein